MLAQIRSIPEALRYGGLMFSAETLLDAMDGIAYLVAPDGVVLAVSNKLINASARDGNRAGHADERALAQPLSVGITGKAVREAYRRLHDAVRDGRRERISFFYRCDSPEVERLAYMTISPVRMEGRLLAVLYQSQLRQEKRREPIGLFDPRNSVASLPGNGARPTVRLCSYCHNVAWPIEAEPDVGYWIRPEDYCRLGGPAQVALSYEVCPACLESIVEANTRPI